MARQIGIALVVLLLTATLLPAAEAVDAPSITVGDSWAYATNTTVDVGFYLRGQATLQVVAREPRTVEGASVEVFRVVLDGAGSAGGTLDTDLGSFRVTGTWRLTGEEWLETAGLKVVRSLLDLRANGTVHTDPLPQGFLLTLQNTTTFRILDDGWRFPLSVGDEGTLTTQANSTQDARFQWGAFSNTTHSNGSAILTLAYAMEAGETVRVPAGSFDAYPVRETWPEGSYDLVSFAPRAGNAVRMETYNDTGVRIATTELVSYRYQALEPTGFLGLDALTWSLILIVVAGVVVTAFAILQKGRARKRDGTTPGEGPPPAAPPPP